MKLMARENLTVDQFVEKTGISRSAMNHIIAGRNNPTLDMVTKIIDALSLSKTEIDELLFGTKEKSTGGEI
jgi:transcriptional regulator with XRE-family HTH domain